MKQKDFIFTMMALILVIVVLLLVTPWVCSCSPGSDSILGLHRIIFGPGPARIVGTPTSTVATITTTATGTTGAATSTIATSTPASVGLAPQVGPVGTAVTIQGSGFSADNTIEMNGLVGGDMKDVVSTDGKTLTFTVPASLGPDCKPMEACPQFLMVVTANTYEVSVVTGATTLDIGTFTVIAK